MDRDDVVEKNREALKRVLAMLVAMTGLGCRGQFTFFPRKGGLPQGDAQAEKSKLPPSLTLPRHLHRAVLRLLRPAEAAVRRLVIVFARELVVEPPPARPRKRKLDPRAAHAVLRNLGIAVVMPAAEIARAAARRAAARIGRPLLLPLLDPLRTPRLRRRTVSPHCAPRILSFHGAGPHRLPPPPSPNDPIDAARLVLRLETLSSALDDLPKHARRFARWRCRVAAGAQNKESRRERGLIRRVSPLRPGRPPGQPSPKSRWPAHEVHDLLGDLQYFAFKALQPPDTS